MILQLTSGLSKVAKPASAARFSISASLNTLDVNLMTGSVDSCPGMSDEGCPGEAKTLRLVSTLTVDAFSRLYFMISGGIRAVSPSVSRVRTLPANFNQV